MSDKQAAVIYRRVTLRNELKRFASGAILSLVEKKSQLASNFKLTRTPTIYREHGIL